jgi:hypothetical protein
MSDYLVVRLIAGEFPFSPRTECYGYVEIRPPKTDTLDEREALQISLSQNEENIDLNTCMRAAVVVEEADNPDHAHTLANSFFEEAIDVLGEESFGRKKPFLLESGFARDCVSGAITGHHRKIGEFDQFPPMFMARRFIEHFPNIGMGQYILGSRASNELSDRYIRSAHWARNASRDRNLHFRLLFNWLATECLLKTQRDEDIVPKMMFCLGFPMGQLHAKLDPVFRTSLEAHPKYDAWKQIIHSWINSIRQFRNDTVHHGYRAWDIDEASLKKYCYILRFARTSARATIETAIRIGINNSSSLWLNPSVVLKSHPNVINFVHGTLIFGLENGDYTKYPEL